MKDVAIYQGNTLILGNNKVRDFERLKERVQKTAKWLVKSYYV